MDWKKLTKNRYTLNDIFTKNHQRWLMVPLMLFLVVPFVHIVVYTFTYRLPETFEELSAVLSKGEFVGDYFIAMIDFAIVIGAVLGIIAVVSFIVNEKYATLKTPKTDYIPMCFFGILCVLMLVANIINGVSTELVFGFTSRGESVFALFAYFLLYYLCGSLVKNEKHKYIAVYTFLALSLTVGIITLWNMYVARLDIIGATGLCAIFYHFNFYGYFLTMAIMFAASLVLTEQKKSRCVFAFLMLCLNSYILAINNTMGCFLACIVAFLFMIVAQSLRQKKFSVGAVALFAVFLAVTFLVSLKYESFFSQLIGLAGDVKSIATNAEDADEAGTARWGLWVNQVNLIKEKPWIGYGFEGACPALDKLTGQDKVHNEYLNYAGDYGIPSALIYIAGLLSIYIRALKKRVQVDGATFCCLVAALGYIGSSFFGNSMVFITPFFFIFLGLANSISSPELVKEMNGITDDESAAEATACEEDAAETDVAEKSDASEEPDAAETDVAEKSDASEEPDAAETDVAEKSDASEEPDAAESGETEIENAPEAENSDSENTSEGT